MTRLYYRLDNTSRWHETTVEKSQFIEDDLVITHTEDLAHLLVGGGILTGKPVPAVFIDAPQYIHRRNPGGMTFFTRIPRDTFVDRKTDAVELNILFGPDWLSP